MRRRALPPGRPPCRKLAGGILSLRGRYNAGVKLPSAHAIDYEPSSRKGRLRRSTRVIMWAVGLLVLGLISPFLAYVYTSAAYDGLTPGMTRTQLVRHLLAFTSHPSPTWGAGPGESVIVYELLWFGKKATIIVIFESDGRSRPPIPAFEN